MNINTGKTGTINIPAPLHSTGGDGDGQVGNVVAYTGDIYDDEQEKNQKTVNKETKTTIGKGFSHIKGSFSTAFNPSDFHQDTDMTKEIVRVRKMLDHKDYQIQDIISDTDIKIQNILNFIPEPEEATEGEVMNLVTSIFPEIEDEEVLEFEYPTSGNSKYEYSVELNLWKKLDTEEDDGYDYYKSDNYHISDSTATLNIHLKQSNPVTLYYYFDTESGWDKLYIYIDGVFNGEYSGLSTGVTGNIDGWIPLTISEEQWEGDILFKYSKDGSVDSSGDSVTVKIPKM